MTRVNWDLKKIRAEIESHLETLSRIDQGQPLDHSGGSLPLSLSILFLLEQISQGTFYGTFEMTFKGTLGIVPRKTAETYSLTESHSRLLT